MPSLRAKAALKARLRINRGSVRNGPGAARTRSGLWRSEAFFLRLQPPARILNDSISNFHGPLRGIAVEAGGRRRGA